MAIVTKIIKAYTFKESINTKKQLVPILNTVTQGLVEEFSLKV
ncbi:hypothetical protein AOB58_2765 (plasmid) [Staphylococcus sp. AntiMn-1]|nr:hypothetical protein AOB58_2765 [Staphylococcus sp. AntiMn-1]